MGIGGKVKLVVAEVGMFSHLVFKTGYVDKTILRPFRSICYTGSMAVQPSTIVLDLPRWVSGERPFTTRETLELNDAATSHGFCQKRPRNWVRRTIDFIQLINLQFSDWSPDEGYLNFALWPLAFGEPPTIAQSKFPFSTRAELIARDIPTLFQVADRFGNLPAFRQAYEAGLLAQSSVTIELQQILKKV